MRIDIVKEIKSLLVSFLLKDEDEIKDEIVYSQIDDLVETLFINIMIGETVLNNDMYVLLLQYKDRTKKNKIKRLIDALILRWLYSTGHEINSDAICVYKNENQTENKIPAMQSNYLVQDSDEFTVTIPE